jgi:hypothetical protein
MSSAIRLSQVMDSLFACCRDYPWSGWLSTLKTHVQFDDSVETLSEEVHKQVNVGYYGTGCIPKYSLNASLQDGE